MLLVTVDYGNQFRNMYEFKALEKRAVKKKITKADTRCIVSHKSQ